MEETTVIRVKVDYVYPDPTQWKRYGVRAGSNIWVRIQLPMYDVLGVRDTPEGPAYDLSLNGLKQVTKQLAQMSIQLEEERKAEIAEEEYNAYT